MNKTEGIPVVMIDPLEKLKQEYAASLPQKKDSIAITVQAVMRAIQAKENLDWTTLSSLVHKFAGSSGTYGFMDLSNLARDLELKIDDGTLDKMKDKEISFYLAGWLTQFTKMIDDAVKNFASKAA